MSPRTPNRTGRQHKMSYTVSQVASLASVSVRTLHHYDETGLLTPSKRSEAGYRLYNDSDLERLQQVLFFRELGFALDVIAGLMKEPGFDRESALLMQRELLRRGDRRYRGTASGRRAPSPDRPQLLPLFEGDAREPGQDVRRRSPLRQDLRRRAPRARAVPVRCDPDQRRVELILLGAQGLQLGLGMLPRPSAVDLDLE
jgi:DNA-binding transcriptional MerR regulator